MKKIPRRKLLGMTIVYVIPSERSESRDLTMREDQHMRKDNRKSGAIFRKISALAFLGLGIMAAGVSVKAGVIEPSGITDPSDPSDKRLIQHELDNTGSVTLVPGETYYLNGPIFAHDNQSIEAEGATIYFVADKDMIMNNPQKGAYSGLVNFSVNGGTWLSCAKDGYKGSSIKLTHAGNVRLTNMKIKHANYSGHTIELIACKDVLVENCILEELGKPQKGSVEECLQIDIAAPHTAPFLYSNNKKLVDGSCCKNITVRNCSITGCRGLCANGAVEDKEYRDNFHSGIVIENCNITGMVSEGLTLYNVASGKVVGNTIVCKNKAKAEKSVGLKIETLGQGSVKNLTVKKNTIKGKWVAIRFGGGTGARYNKLTFNNNKLYAGDKEMVMNIALSQTSMITNKIVFKKNKNFTFKK